MWDTIPSQSRGGLGFMLGIIGIFCFGVLCFVLAVSKSATPVASGTHVGVLSSSFLLTTHF